MGTDIHWVFQKRNGSKWVDVNDQYDGDRHYYLFSHLADVRNGFGFAGVTTYEPVEPLSSRRGYPEDFQVNGDDEHELSPGVLKKWYEDSETYWMGDHSHTWLTGEELMQLEGVEGLDYFVDEVKRLISEHGEIRLVCGFDS